jgi:hypothetical protein
MPPPGTAKAGIDDTRVVPNGCALADHRALRHDDDVSARVIVHVMLDKKKVMPWLARNPST